MDKITNKLKRINLYAIFSDIMRCFMMSCGTVLILAFFFYMIIPLTQEIIRALVITVFILFVIALLIREHLSKWKHWFYAETAVKDVNIVKENCSISFAVRDEGVSFATGNCSASSTVGYQGRSLATGDYSASSSIGDEGLSITTGCRSASTATGCQSSSFAIGDESVSAVTGYYGTSFADGNCSVSVATGFCGTSYVQHKNAIAVAWGFEARAKGVIGSYIVCAEWKIDSETEIWHFIQAKMAKVDGEKIKENTYYQLIDGKFIEKGEPIC